MKKNLTKNVKSLKNSNFTKLSVNSLLKVKGGTVDRPSDPDWGKP